MCVHQVMLAQAHTHTSLSLTHSHTHTHTVPRFISEAPARFRLKTQVNSFTISRVIRPNLL